MHKLTHVHTEQAWQPFSKLNVVLPYRDATWIKSTFDLHVKDLWAGLLRAVATGVCARVIVCVYVCVCVCVCVLSFPDLDYARLRSTPPPTPPVCSGVYVPKSFCKAEYMYYDNPLNGDLHEVCPNPQTLNPKPKPYMYYDSPLNGDHHGFCLANMKNKNSLSCKCPKEQPQ